MAAVTWGYLRRALWTSEKLRLGSGAGGNYTWFTEMKEKRHHGDNNGTFWRDATNNKHDSVVTPSSPNNFRRFSLWARPLPGGKIPVKKPCGVLSQVVNTLFADNSVKRE